MAKALYIDDDLYMHRLVKLLFKDQNIQFDFVAEGRSALKYLMDNQYDIIFTDIQMPGISGIELIQKIREKQSSIPIVIVSAFKGKLSISELEYRNDIRIIDKPFTRKQIMSVAQELLKY
ncbi:MAG: response regulator [Caldithrix sp.]|nr:response regulator [Caldithrix sp.]